MEGTLFSHNLTYEPFTYGDNGALKGVRVYVDYHDAFEISRSCKVIFPTTLNAVRVVGTAINSVHKHHGMVVGYSPKEDRVSVLCDNGNSYECRFCPDEDFALGSLAVVFEHLDHDSGGFDWVATCRPTPYDYRLVAIKLVGLDNSDDVIQTYIVDPYLGTVHLES